ncbi:PAS domain-containing sensor histidine kinase [Oleispirillum naphthae]|uniref:sensor histidine kinase NtrY-like n=1 Tax=Oleispirillum naphthae TaxID=2838853 RepID=UPI0030822C30
MATASPKTSPHRFGMRLGLWARRVRLARRLAVALALGALVSGVLTMAALFGSGPLKPSQDMAFLFLNLDLAFLLALGIVVGRRLVQIYLERRKGVAGSKLQSRLVLTFGLLSVVPTVLVGSFSAVFFHNGLQGWFSDRVRIAVHESLVVAEAYLREHQQAVATDVLALAQDTTRNWNVLFSSESRLNGFLRQQTLERGLSEAVIFNQGGTVLGRAGFTFSLRSEDVPMWALDKARRGEVALLTSGSDDRVRALMRLDVLAPGEIFLYIGRFVDANVINHIEQAQQAVQAYQTLEIERWDFELTFTLVYILVSLLLLLAAMWLGLTLSNQLVQPISALIGASEKVAEGDLSATVRESAYADEVSVLSRAFNRMIRQVAEQRESLLDANQQLDQRRRFTEAVLTGVSAGVLGLDALGRVSAINPSAAELLSLDTAGAVGRSLSDLAPDLDSAFTEMRHASGRSMQKPVTIRRGGHERVLLVRVSAELSGLDVIGYVLTFDDVTELQAAQRAAAWSDVARRIAHEIKNPLTPIQLSAERLRHKYEPQITEGQETFRACTDTIVRQVADIRRLVDEFSSFARMPTPEFVRENLGLLVQQAAELQRSAYPQIAIGLKLPEAPVFFECDRGLIAQAFTNLLKNAIESIEDRQKTRHEPPGRVGIALTAEGGRIRVEICDNGMGLPKADRQNLTNPYITTREKGTGLGLAIVKKIMEDHRGRLLLLDREGEGARIVLEFPLPESAETGILPSRDA